MLSILTGCQRRWQKNLRYPSIFLFAPAMFITCDTSHTALSWWQKKIGKKEHIKFWIRPLSLHILYVRCTIYYITLQNASHAYTRYDTVFFCYWNITWQLAVFKIRKSTSIGWPVNAKKFGTQLTGSKNCCTHSRCL